MSRSCQETRRNERSDLRANMVRIQLELPESQVRKIEKLMDKSGTKTKKDFFNNALSVLEWAIDERENNRTVASINEAENSYKELNMPILSHIGKG